MLLSMSVTESIQWMKSDTLRVSRKIHERQHICSTHFGSDWTIGHFKATGLAYTHVYVYTNTNFFVYVYGIRVCIGVFGCMYK